MNVIYRLPFAPIATTSTRRLLIKQRIITRPQPPQPPQPPPPPHQHNLRRFALFFSSSSSSSSSFSSSSKSNTTTTTKTQNYNFAITRNVPKSFANAVVKFATININNEDDDNNQNKNNNLNWMESQRQLDNYVNVLRNNVGIPTIALETLEDHPDCTFVEDTVVVIKDTAVITNPGHITRKGEVDTIKSLLQQLGIKNIIDMRDDCYNNTTNTTIICDGGDVLYTGRHLFVGISERTNMEAVNVLSTTFQDYIVGEETIIPVPIKEGDGNQHALHLKSIVTALDSHTLLIPQGKYGDTIMKQMNATDLGYDCIRLPNLLCCNVISVNNYILAQDNQGCIETRQILQDICKTKGLQLEFVNFSEFAKADAALTCCSILLSI